MGRALITLIALTAIASVQLLAPVAARAEDWLTYRNERFGTTIEYPDIFKPQPPPVDGDGLDFKTADGADLAVFASYNALNFDLAGFKNFTAKNLAAGKVIIYQAQGSNWFVLSGTDGNGVFYERHMLSHGGQMTEGLVISYPASLKQEYDPLISRISKSFRSGVGSQTP